MTVQARLGSQIATSVVQVVVSTLVVLALYRYVIGVIGVDGLGAWSLVLAVGSTMQVAALALPAAITRRVAESLAANDPMEAASFVETAVLLTAALAVAVALVALPFGEQFLRFSLRGPLVAEAVSLLPLAVGAFVVSMVAGAYQAALYGVGRITERNGILILDSFLHAGACLAAVGTYGLTGLVWARLVTNIITLVCFALAARADLQGLSVLPHRWSQPAFRELWRQGAQLQAISILVLFAEPVTKALLGRFGSVALVGYFEMANRLVQALRSLFVSANQVVLPRFATQQVAGPAQVADLFYTAHRLTFVVAVPAFAVLVVGGPLVSWLWLGTSDPGFVAALMLLGCGWLLNVLAVPAYFASLGTGNIRPNLVSHGVMSAINVCGGVLLGVWLGGAGVLLAWLIALAASAAILLLMFFGPGRIPYARVVPSGQRVLTIVIGSALAAALVCYGPFGFDGIGLRSAPLESSAVLSLVVALATCVALLAPRARGDLILLVGGLLGRPGDSGR